MSSIAFLKNNNKKKNLKCFTCSKSVLKVTQIATFLCLFCWWLIIAYQYSFSSKNVFWFAWLNDFSVLSEKVKVTVNDLWPCLRSVKLVLFVSRLLWSVGLRLTLTGWTVRHQGPKCALGIDKQKKKAVKKFWLKIFLQHRKLASCYRDWFHLHLRNFVPTYVIFFLLAYASRTVLVCWPPQPQTKVTPMQATGSKFP